MAEQPQRLGDPHAAASGPKMAAWLRGTDLPSEYREHELVSNQIFLTLPEGLLDAIDKAIDGPNKLADGIELKLSRICGDHTQHVGFRNAAPIVYQYLRRQAAANISLNESALKFLSHQGIADAQSKLQTAERVLRRHFAIAKSYAGWLLTHPPYVEEQDTLVRAHRQEIAQRGTPNLGRPVTAKVPSEIQVTPAPALQRHVAKFEAFYLRWRLSGLAAPNLPLPIPPQTPAPAAIFTAGPMNEVGALFYLPDTYPVPSRDELRAMIEDALHGGQEGVEHLSGWIKMIRGGNTAKNAITRFGRILEIQHYSRILEERHSDQIKRQQGRLERAIAKFLKVSTETVHKDFLFIRKRLGNEWMRRANNTPTMD